MALRKIDLMHRQFGKCEGHTCRECSNLVEGRYHDKMRRKCKVYGMTHSEASDWAKSGYNNSDWMKLDEPVKLCINFCKKYKQYDTVLVSLEQYIGYCMCADLPLDRPKED